MTVNLHLSFLLCYVYIINLFSIFHSVRQLDVSHRYLYSISRKRKSIWKTHAQFLFNYYIICYFYDIIQLPFQFSIVSHRVWCSCRMYITPVRSYAHRLERNTAEFRAFSKLQLPLQHECIIPLSVLGIAKAVNPREFWKSGDLPVAQSVIRVVPRKLERREMTIV